MRRWPLPAQIAAYFIGVGTLAIAGALFGIGWVMASEAAAELAEEVGSQT